MKKIINLFIALSLSTLTEAQQYFRFSNTSFYGRTEWCFENSPTNLDNNRIVVGWLKGQQSSPGTALFSTFVMQTDTIRFPKLSGLGVAAIGLNANGSLYRLDRYSLIDSTFFATRSWVNSVLPNITGKLNISDTATMLTPYALLSELTWGNIIGKPTTFMPAAHMHGITDVMSLQDSLNDKYPRFSNPAGYLTSVPAQSFASLTGKPTTLAGYGITDAYPLTGNPAGYITQAYNPTAGNGIRITGTFPTQTISVDTSVATSGNNAVMYVGKANTAISNLQAGVNSKEPIIDPGTTAQYWRGDKTWQTLNTSAVPEGTNQYYTNARSRSAISVTTTGTGAATYNSTTGVINIPIPSGTSPGINNAAAYSSGTVYTLTTTSQKVDFGTTDPVITIPAPGTYLIMTNLKVEYAGLTTVLNACNFKLRRTNNTASDIQNATTTFNVVATLLTGTGGDVDIAPIIYTTTNSNDVIELWGNRQNGISVTGNINVGEASIVAVRIY